jgi:hypothetical protein
MKHLPHAPLDLPARAVPENLWRPRLLNVLMPLLLSVLSLFATIEVGFRHFYRLIPQDVCAADYIIGTYDCQPYFVYDEPIALGYHYRPGLHLEGMWNPADPHLANPEDNAAPAVRHDAFYYVLQTDEMGFPNAEYSWRDQYNLVIAGDSFTIRTAPQTWIELLAEETGLTTLTLGAPSWSTLNEAEAIGRFGLDKKPRWVLLMFFEGNDIINTAQYLERRDSGLDWRDFDMQHVPWWRRLLTPYFARFFWGKLLPPAAAKAKAYRYPVAASTEAGIIKTIFKDVHLLPLSADYQTLARSDEFMAVTQSLIDLNTRVRAQDGRFLVVYIPSKEHVLWSRVWDPVDVNNVLERTVTVTLSKGDHGQLQWQPHYLDYDTFSTNQRAQEQLLTDFTAANDIAFLNLTPLFWQKSIETGELYNYADPHWNQAGNRLAAEAIATYLQTH